MTVTHSELDEVSLSRLRAMLSEVASIVAGVPSAEVTGRQKTHDSAQTKADRLDLSATHLFDLLGVRVVVQEVEDCYQVVSLIHQRFQYLSREYEDYILRPKRNGYRSIHTVVIDRVGQPIEVQVRTREMHDCAQWGSAAHARYKRLQKGREPGGVLHRRLTLAKMLS